MSGMEEQTAKIIEQLRKELREVRRDNNQLRSENKWLMEKVEQLENENRRLCEQLELAQQQATRQAAPFRREELKKIPPHDHKPPGQKPGHPGCCRKEPDHIDQTIELPLERCPKCNGPVKDIERIEQIIEEIPPVRPYVVRLITYRGRCECCGDIATRHPLQTSVGTGAARVQLGPRALALAACLNKVHGLTMRKKCKVLKDLCGLGITAGGLSQALCRMAGRVRWIYDKLIDEIRASPAVFANETSWWVGGGGWWLWTFTSPE